MKSTEQIAAYVFQKRDEHLAAENNKQKKNIRFPKAAVWGSAAAVLIAGAALYFGQPDDTIVTHSPDIANTTVAAGSGVPETVSDRSELPETAFTKIPETEPSGDDTTPGGAMEFFTDSDEYIIVTASPVSGTEATASAPSWALETSAESDGNYPTTAGTTAETSADTTVPAGTAFSAETAESARTTTFPVNTSQQPEETAGEVAVMTTAVTTTHRQPAETASTTIPATEIGMIPKWDEKEIYSKYTFFQRDTKEYVISGYADRPAVIPADRLEKKLYETDISGFDVYTDKTLSIHGDIYEISGIDPDLFVGVKYEGYPECYSFMSRAPEPATLGELIDALDLMHTLSVNKVYRENNTQKGDLSDISVLLNILDKYRNVRCEITDSYHFPELVDLAVDVKLLGIENHSLHFTGDGYIWTNIMQWGFSFYIGEDAARECAEKIISVVDFWQNIAVDHVQTSYVEETYLEEYGVSIPNELMDKYRLTDISRDGWWKASVLYHTDSVYIGSVYALEKPVYDSALDQYSNERMNMAIYQAYLFPDAQYSLKINFIDKGYVPVTIDGRTFYYQPEETSQGRVIGHEFAYVTGEHLMFVHLPGSINFNDITGKYFPEAQAVPEVVYAFTSSAGIPVPE